MSDITSMGFVESSLDVDWCGAFEEMTDTLGERVLSKNVFYDRVLRYLPRAFANCHSWTVVEIIEDGNAFDVRHKQSFGQALEMPDSFVAGDLAHHALTCSRPVLERAAVKTLYPDLLHMCSPDEGIQSVLLAPICFQERRLALLIFAAVRWGVQSCGGQACTRVSLAASSLSWSISTPGRQQASCSAR